jgi:hypothetical protein
MNVTKDPRNKTANNTTKVSLLQAPSSFRFSLPPSLLGCPCCVSNVSSVVSDCVLSVGEGSEELVLTEIGDGSGGDGGGEGSTGGSGPVLVEGGFLWGR